MALCAGDIAAISGEIQRAYLWCIDILALPGAIMQASTAGGTFADTKAFMNDAAPYIDYFCDKAPYPHRKTRALEFRYAGERSWLAGVEESEKRGDFRFVWDQAKVTSTFWKVLRDLTGDYQMHAQVGRFYSTFDMGVATVHTDKRSITEYNVFGNCQVFSIDIEGSSLDRGSDTLAKMVVNIGWDYTIPLTSSHAAWKNMEKKLAFGPVAWNADTSKYGESLADPFKQSLGSGPSFTSVQKEDVSVSTSVATSFTNDAGTTFTLA